MPPRVLLLLVLLVELSPAIASDTDRTKKIDLVRKYMRRHKKPVRLVNGRGLFEGNVEVYHSGKWGSVCDDEWDENEASVVCRQLGFEKALKPTHSSHFGTAKRRFWMDNLECDGSEASLSDCRFDGWGKHDCKENEGAGVVCDVPEAVTQHPVSVKPSKTKLKDKEKGNWKIRIEGGRISQEGRVELKTHSSEFSPICGDGWSLLEANVVCKELGLGFASDAPQTDFFGGNRSAMLFSGVRCIGNEGSLSECLRDEIFSCPGVKPNFAGVICTQKMADLALDADEIMRTVHLEDRQLFFLQCAMEENCLASAAYELQKQHPNHWHLETRRLLRFTLRALNAGSADFKPFIPKHLWEWHACHMHFHSMEVFATFDVLNKYGVRVAEGHKASFCLEDNQCLPGVEPAFACANYGDQGISVNCSDIYKHNIDCQWVDISELDPGMYTLKGAPMLMDCPQGTRALLTPFSGTSNSLHHRAISHTWEPWVHHQVSINPEFKIGEMSFDNNAAVCNMHYSETFVYVHNCTLQRP